VEEHEHFDQSPGVRAAPHDRDLVADPELVGVRHEDRPRRFPALTAVGRAREDGVAAERAREPGDRVDLALVARKPAAVPDCVGEVGTERVAVIEFLSLNWNSESSRTSWVGGPQVSPPSVDRLTYMIDVLKVGKSWNVIVITSATPFGEIATHGSVARSKAPPEHFETPGMTTCCHAPLWNTHATVPRDPPFDQRSCW
jgi:hypothetical protein